MWLHTSLQINALQIIATAKVIEQFNHQFGENLV